MSDLKKAREEFIESSHFLDITTSNFIKALEQKLADTEKSNAEMLEHKKADKACIGMLEKRVFGCRDYLMQVEPDEITVENTLVSLGYNKDGY